jgi:hypothetical protein
MTPEQQQATYQGLAAQDPEMAAFTPEQHMEFAKGMEQQFNPAVRAQNAIGEGTTGGGILEAFAPVASQMAQGATPDEMAQQQVAGGIGSTMAVLGEALKQLMPGGLASGQLAEPFVGAALDSMLSRAETGANILQSQGELASTPGVLETPRLAAAGEVITETAKDIKSKGIDTAAAGFDEFMRATYGEDYQKQWDFSKPNIRNNLEKAYDTVAQGLVSMGPALFANAVGGAPGKVVGAADMYAQIAGDISRGVREKGGEMGGIEALAVGAPAAGMEALSLGKLMKIIPGSAPILKKVFESVATEFVTEGAQETYAVGTEAAKTDKPILPEIAENIGRIGEAAVGGGLTGGVVGGGGAVVHGNIKKAQDKEYAKVTEKISEVQEYVDQGATLTEAFGKAGLAKMSPDVAPDIKEARFSVASERLDYLEKQEMEEFIRGPEEPMDVATIADRVKRDPQEIQQEIDMAEMDAQRMTNPESTMAEETEDSQLGVAAVQESLEMAAVRAEQDGNFELAKRRRAAKEQVKAVEPDPKWGDAVRGVASLGSGAKLVFIEQNQEDAQVSGVFVKKGLIVVDSSRQDGKIMPQIILGTTLHELVHNQEAANLPAYQGAMMALKDSPLWEESKADLEKLENAVINDDEIMAHMMELPDTVPAIMNTLADRTTTEKLAKAPGPIRALAEWLATKFETISKKLGFDPAKISDTRDRARAYLELTKLLEAGEQPTGTQQEPGAPKYSQTLKEFGAATEKGDPRKVMALDVGMDSFYEAVQRKFNEAKAAHPGWTEEQQKKWAGEQAKDIARISSEILEEKDLDDEQTMYKKFAKLLGIEVTYYRNTDSTTGGFTSIPGQLFLNVDAIKNHREWTIPNVIAHEITHDLKKRDSEAWDALWDLANEKMVNAVRNARMTVRHNYKIDKWTEEMFNDEVMAHVVGTYHKQFWGAVAALGEDSTSKPAFKRFFKWASDLLNKIKSAGQQLGLFPPAEAEAPAKSPSLDVNVRRGDHVTMIATANAIQNLATDTGGEYSVYAPEKRDQLEKTQKDRIKESKKDPDLEPHQVAEVEYAAQTVKELKFSPKRRSGYPPPAQTPQQLGAWRRRVAGLINRGEEGRYWYERSSEAIITMTGGDLRLAVKFARLLAVYSPTKTVMINWHAALSAWQKYMSGYTKDEFLQESIGYMNNHKKAADILYEDSAWSGEKTNNFFANLIALIDPEQQQGVTVDVWMMRALGFSGNAPTAKQYKEMSKEVSRIAKKLGVENYQAQAMIWVYAKTVWESGRVTKKVEARAEKSNTPKELPVLLKNGEVKMKDGEPVMKPNPAYEQIQREEFHKEVSRDLGRDLSKFPISEAAMITFKTALERRLGYLSQEAIPGSDSGALPGIITADLATKAEFTKAIEDTMVNEFGEDIIGRVIGLSPAGMIGNMLLEPSAYYNNNGELEVNPARQIELPVAAKQGADSTKTLEAGSLELMKLYAALRGAFTSQEGVAGYRPFDTAKKAERNMVSLDKGRSFTEDEVKDLLRAVADRIGVDNAWTVALYPTQDGMNALYVGEDFETNEEFHEFMKEIGKELGVKTSTFGAETFFIPAEGWMDGQEDYSDILGDYPEVVREVERRVADKLAAVYQEYSDRGFGPPPAWVEDRKQAPWRVTKKEDKIGTLIEDATEIADVDYREQGTYTGIDLHKDDLGGVDRPAAQYIASLLKPGQDSYAIFPPNTELGPLRQAFTTVRSTPVGLVARNPRIPSITSRVIEGMPAPKSTLDKVSKDTKFSPARQGVGWNMPKMNKWARFVKRVQDSFIRFKTLNEVLDERGAVMRDSIDVRLQEELYHGRVQNETERMYATYIGPLMREMRAFGEKEGVNHEELLKKFDKYLHARHAPERNKHITEAWRNRKLARLADKKHVVESKLKDLRRELAEEAVEELHITRVRDSIRFWEMRQAEIEAAIEKVHNQPELNSGMSNKDAQKVMIQTREDGLMKIFRRWATTFVDPVLKERVQGLLDAGMITESEMNSIQKYKYYVPLKGNGLEAGDIDEILETYHDFGQGSGFDIRGQELPFVVGRKDRAPVNPILAQVVVDSMATIDRIERNKVAVALLGLAQENPNPNLWEINKRVNKRVYNKKTGEIDTVKNWWANNEKNVVAAKRDGQTYYITLYDPGMIEAMKGLGVENLWKWVRSVRMVMRTLAQLYTTWSPEFILTNFARDWQQAVVSGTTDMGVEAAKNIAKNSSRAVRGILAANFPEKFKAFRNEYTEAYEELKKKGGKVGFFGMQGIEDTQKKLLDEMRTDPQIRTVRGVKAVGDLVSRINEATENGIRLATYVEAKRQGLSYERAASLAKNVSVNFNRRGDIGGAIGAGYLFFNAGVQGVDRFFRSMKTPAGQKLALAYMGIGFLTSIYSRAIMGDDEDGQDLYGKISPWTMGRHWIIGIPGTNGQFIQVPMPYGFGVFGQLGKELEDMVFGDGKPKERAIEGASRMLAGLTTHFSPLGETSFDKGWYAMARPVVPTLFEPFSDVAMNETYWGGKVYPAASPWDRRASSHRVFPAKTVTDKIAQGLTQKLNKYTGGSVYRSGIIDLNADGLTYVLDSFVGPAGNFIKRPFNLMQKKAAGDKTTWNDWIVIRRFLSETAPEYYVPGEFYDAIDDVRRAVDEQRWMQKNGASGEDFKRWNERHGWKLSLDKAAREAQQDVSDMRDRDDREQTLRRQRAFVKMYLRAAE